MTYGRRSFGFALVTVGLCLGSACTVAEAAALSLAYTVTPTGGGLYEYNFTLGVDTSSGPLNAGEGWSYIVFGDRANAYSPLTDFSVGSIQGGPWTSLFVAAGFHNGQTLGPIFDSSSNVVYLATGLKRRDDRMVGHIGGRPWPGTAFLQHSFGREYGRLPELRRRNRLKRCP